jgi:hypothetical protein
VILHHLFYPITVFFFVSELCGGGIVMFNYHMEKKKRKEKKISIKTLIRKEKKCEHFQLGLRHR